MDGALEYSIFGWFKLDSTGPTKLSPNNLCIMYRVLTHEHD